MKKMLLELSPKRLSDYSNLIRERRLRAQGKEHWAKYSEFDSLDPHFAKYFVMNDPTVPSSEERFILERDVRKELIPRMMKRELYDINSEEGQRRYQQLLDTPTDVLWCQYKGLPYQERKELDSLSQYRYKYYDESPGPALTWEQQLIEDGIQDGLMGWGMRAGLAANEDNPVRLTSSKVENTKVNEVERLDYTDGNISRPNGTKNTNTTVIVIRSGTDESDETSESGAGTFSGVRAPDAQNKNTGKFFRFFDPANKSKLIKNVADAILDVAGRRYEVGYFLEDANQAPTLGVIGSRKQIAMPEDAPELENVKRTIFVHNHPTLDSFSPEDIWFAKTNNLSEIIVVASDGNTTIVYSIKPVNGKWGFEDDDLKNVYRDSMRQAQKMLGNTPLAATLTTEEYVAHLSNLAWEMAADELGLQYNRTILKQ